MLDAARISPLDQDQDQGQTPPPDGRSCCLDLRCAVLCCVVPCCIPVVCSCASGVKPCRYDYICMHYNLVIAMGVAVNRNRNRLCDRENKKVVTS